MRASALVFTHVSEEHDFGASVFGEVLDVYGAHVLSEMAGAEFNHHARLVFRDSERVFSFVLFAGVGRVFAELGVRSLRGGFLDLSNHGRDGRETSEEDRDWVAVRGGCRPRVRRVWRVRVCDYFVRRVFVQRQDESVVGVRDYELWQMEFWVGYGHEHVSRVVAD